MAGTDRRFDATKFRSGIRFAMNMGFPGEEVEQIAWRWNNDRTFQKADSGGAPYDWTAAEVVTQDPITDFIVDCAVKFSPGTSKTRVGGTAEGIFDIGQIEVTMLDTDWDLMIAHGGRIPERAVIDETIYIVQYVGPPVGLFDVTIYTIYAQAIDQQFGDT